MAWWSTIPVLVLIYVTLRRLWKPLFTKAMICTATRYNQRMYKRKLRLFSGLKDLKQKKNGDRLVIADIGCGVCPNFQFYPPGSDVICVEPKAQFEAQARERFRQYPELRMVAFHAAKAESLTDVISSGSVDAVVITSVLCCTDDTARALQEFLRILRPGGKVFFMEHIYASAATHQALRRAQWLLRYVWMMVFRGCHICRDTAKCIRTAGFQTLELEEFQAYELTHPTYIFPGCILVRPHIMGIASK